MTDTDEQNGCPWVVPGLHKLGTLAHETTDLGFRCIESSQDAIAVPAKVGDIVVFSSLTPHRTGPNGTEGIRKSYILQYAADGARGIGPHGEDTGLQNAPDRQYEVLVDGNPAHLG